MALAWNKIEIPLAAGLDTKEDVRSGDASKLDIARDIQFDETGGVQTRLPYGSVMGAGAIFGGGTLSNCRRLAVVNGELCVFTDTSLYSWNAQLSKWVLRSTHPAVSVDETTTFATPGDQYDGDRAELNGTVMFTWVEASVVFVAALDKTTGAVLMPPTSFGSGIVPRLVACSTKIIGFYALGATLKHAIFDPANPAAASFSNLFAANVAGVYDVTRIEGQDGAVGAFQQTVNTSYTVFTVMSSGSSASSTKARTCSGPIAVGTTPSSGVQVQVVRANGTNIQGDLLTTSTLADVTINQAVGTAASTAINQITLAFASGNAIGVFWTSGNIGETSGVTDFVVKFNTITSGAPGTQADFRHRLGIASRAFMYAGRVYVWLAFAQDSGVSVTGNSSTVRAQLQNTYFLYRDDAVIISQCTKNVGGGFAATAGRLPGVALTSGSTTFSWCATVRRRIELGTGPDHSAFGARSPRDVMFTFDSNQARRVGRIGRTMYITGGIPLQYDGLQTAEVGFLNYPWYFEPAQGGAGNLAAGAYTWMGTYRWPNAQGEIDRSTTATGMTLTIAASKFVFLNTVFLNTTLKVGARRPTIDMWRTQVGAGEDAPFYLVTSQDPTALPGANNGYVINDDTLESPGIPLPDNFADATLITKETNPENGGVLEYLAPPGAALIAETDTRLYLGGVAGDPDRVWYSRLRRDGEVASFHDALVASVPRPGGAMTALALNAETLTVFRETAIYALPGDGFNNTGQGSNYGPARLISSDVGAVSQESVALTPRGVVFKSSKGWYLLGPDWSLRYIGANVTSFDADTVYAVDVVETQHHVRILTSGRMLIWDYLVNQWGEWTITDGVHAVIWNGTHVYLTATGPKQQQTSFSSVTYGLDIETSWLKPAEQQGDIAVKLLAALGEYRSAHLLRWRVARDYQYDGSGNVVYFDDSVWTPTPTTVGSLLQSKHAPSISRCQAFKVRLTAVAESVRATLVTTSLSPQVATSGTVWNSTWRAVDSRPGVMGNAISMSVAFTTFSVPDLGGFPYDLPFSFVSETGSIVINDHFTYSMSLGRWREDLNNVGVLVAGDVTVAELESTIAEFSTLIDLSAADASPSKTINVASMISGGSAAAGSFSGGTYGSPTGEALKLTGLAADVGVQRGIRRLPAGQVAP